MSLDFNLKPLFASDIASEKAWNSPYDLVLIALGYEERSRHLAISLKGNAKRKIAVPFSEDRILSYEINLSKITDLGYEISEVKEDDFVDWWISEIELATTGLNTEARICVDISSLTRRRLAHILEGLSRANVEHRLAVTFVYTVAAFTPPSSSSETATTCGPVSSYLAGWPADPDKSVAAIIGLGYELEKAIGALEYLEPTTRILVKPISKDDRYDKEVNNANSELLDNGSRSETYSYPISSPTQCIELLDALAYRLKNDCRVVMIPFGPKIFALCSMLIACKYYPEIGIWRISAEDSSGARDQKASDQTVCIQVKFGRP